MTDLKDRDVTPEALHASRRAWLKNAGLYAGSAALLGVGAHLLAGGGRRPSETTPSATPAAPGSPPLTIATRGEYTVNEPSTPLDDVTSYNNYYELDTSKEGPARLAHTLRPRPWTVEITGEVHQPHTVDLDSLLSWFPQEERIYRFRCVEAWSMVIPWVGFPLKALLDRVRPTGFAEYVAFTTLYDPKQLPGQNEAVLDWPYVEALRIDEAMHPLTLLATGLYGRVLPGQNGAPLRLVVPWKYGFKGIKSIVKIELTREQPKTTWSHAGPSEYGFYANVNPAVPHPRWSQATERRIGELRRRPTLPFNGYAEQVASLYTGLDPTTLY